MIKMKRIFLAVFAGLVSVSDPAGADEVANFYSGKTITIVVGSPPGGSYDLYARAIAHILPKYLPGAPTVIVQNMPGAGSLIAANYVSNVAPRDGTVITALNSTVPYQKLFGIPSVKFDPVRMNWLPSPSGFTALLLVSKNAPVQSFADLQKRSARIATLSPGATPSFFAAIFNDVFKTKIVPITGHPSMPEALLAMQRGEVDGFPSTPWSSLRRNYAAQFANGDIRVLLQYGQSRVPELGDVPFAQDIAPTPEDRELLDIALSPTILGFPYMMSPEVPKERVEAFRQALSKVFTDEAFKADAAKMTLDIAPIAGADAQRIVYAAYNAGPTITDRLRMIYNTQLK